MLKAVLCLLCLSLSVPALAQYRPPGGPRAPGQTTPPSGPRGGGTTGGAYEVTSCQIQNTPNGYLLVRAQENSCRDSLGRLNTLFTSVSYFDATVGFQMLICPTNPIPPGWYQVANSNVRQCGALFGTSIWIQKFQ